jgi:hypothetical protein
MASQRTLATNINIIPKHIDLSVGMLTVLENALC